MRLAGFPHRRVLPTRWDDNDVYGHVNNVRFYAFFDTAINAYLIEAGLDIHGGEAIGLCVESHCEFRAPVAFPDALEAGLRVAHLGTSSVRYELAIAGPAADPVATGWFVHVFVDRERRRPVPIPAPLREALQRLAS